MARDLDAGCKAGDRLVGGDRAPGLVARAARRGMVHRDRAFLALVSARQQRAAHFGIGLLAAERQARVDAAAHPTRAEERRDIARALADIGLVAQRDEAVTCHDPNRALEPRRT